MATLREQQEAIITAAYATDQLATEVARIFDESMNVECWPERYSGDNTKFEAWLQRFEMPGLCPKSIMDMLRASDVFGQSSTSECGGGKEAAYWYPMGSVVIGLATSHNWWLIPGTESVPAVENYTEETEDEEDDD